MIRNDYTFINRLKKLNQKYLKQANITPSPNFKMCLNIDNWINSIKEDMRLKALQRINEGDIWKKEYDCTFDE